MSLKYRSLSFEMEPASKVQNLSDIWQALERESECNFFISWFWISSWLRVMAPEADLCKVYHGQRLVALGLFVVVSNTRHRVLSVVQMRLQTTGVDKKDQIWPEYNNLLVARGFEDKVYRELVGFLEGREEQPWDEFILGPVDESVANDVVAEKCHRYNVWEAPTYGVDLKQVRANELDYVSSLSKNTRYQIRRAIRDFESDLTLSVAQSKEEALQYFDCISKLHIQRWGAQSGFHNELFVKFHKDLILSGLGEGAIELVKLESKSNDIGYLYNFTYRNKVYFYLSGIDLVAEHKRKPGLVLHTYCIQRHLELGAESYDFLGGEARYKKNLGSETGRLVITAFQKPLFKLRAEQIARRFKHFILDFKVGSRA